MTEHVVYVSSKLRHRDIWLKSGIATISTWLHGEEPSPEKYSAMWDRYRSEISRCSALVMYIEPEDQLKGCLIELGMAMMADCMIVLIWTGNVPSLVARMGTIVHHESIRIVGSVEAAADLLR